VTWSNRSEVAVVECGHFPDAFTFCDGDDRCVDEAQTEIRVLVDEFDTALVVGRAEVDNRKIRSRNRTDERRLRARSQSILDQPRRFGDDRRYDQELSAPVPQYIRAVTVTWLVGVGRGEQTPVSTSNNELRRRVRACAPRPRAEPY
jgi:hypothetical protein